MIDWSIFIGFWTVSGETTGYEVTVVYDIRGIEGYTGIEGAAGLETHTGVVANSDFIEIRNVTRVFFLACLKGVPGVMLNSWIGRRVLVATRRSAGQRHHRGCGRAS